MTTILTQKIYLLLSLSIVLITISCNNTNVNVNKVILQEDNDSIVLEIGSDTRFLTKALFSFVNSDGRELLSFEGENKLFFYQLSNGELIHTINLQREGSNGVGTVFGHYPISLDSIYITRRNVPELYLVDGTGNVLEKYSYSHDTKGKLCTHAISSSVVYTPLVKINRQLFLNQLLLHGGNTTGDLLEKSPLAVIIDERSKQVTKSQATYPRLWESIDDFSFSEFSRVFDGERFVYSFFWDENMYVTNIGHTEVTKVPAKSKYIPKIDHTLKRPTDIQNGLRLSVETAKYGNIIYDQYRKVFYRFVYPQTQLEQNEDLSIASTFKKEFSIMILNEDFEVIGETLFPADCYVPSLFFIAQKGLYISNNHIKKADFSEDRLVFKRFVLSRVVAKEQEPGIVEAVKELKDTTTVYTHVSKYPEILNMDEILKDKKHTNWPGNDQRRVAYSFVVEVDGSLSNVKLEKGDAPELNEEMLRLLKMAKFTPGQLEDNTNVRCNSVFLMRFP